MAKSTRKTIPSLADLRRDIDRIDTAMHELLIERIDVLTRQSDVGVAGEMIHQRGRARAAYREDAEFAQGCFAFFR